MNRSKLECWACPWSRLTCLGSCDRFGIKAFGAVVFGMLVCLAMPAYAEWQEQGTVEAQQDQTAFSPRLRRIQELLPNWRDHCLRINDEAATTSEQFALRLAIRELSGSDLGRWLIGQAAARSVLVCLDSETELEAYYRAHLHLIGLNTRLGWAGRTVFLAHELAHVPQHPHFSNNRHFSPEDMLLLHRIREATAEAIATRVLWQLRDRGMESAWQAKLDTAYGDIARLFEAGMSHHKGKAAELRATRSAFHHWFEADWRLEIYDDLMLKTLARIAEDPIGLLPSSRRLSDDYLRNISSYAGQSFLAEGDGTALMRAFDTDWLGSGNQAQLDKILEAAQRGQARPAERTPLAEGAGLSASSSGPIPVDSGGVSTR